MFNAQQFVSARLKATLFSTALLGLTGPASAVPVDIDVPPPAFTDPPSPWTSLSDQAVITYGFKTSWDGIGWTDQQKYFAYDALHQMDDILPDQQFVESGDFTIRWAGSDFFKDWRDQNKYTAPGWNLSNALAVSYKHNNGPWDASKYPNNEIYFNSGYKWSYQILGVDPDGYDFWTVMQHEIIHMLASDPHALGVDEVMYKEIDKGQRKYLQPSDLQLLTGTGYSTNPAAIRTGPLPEPGLLLMIFTGLILMVFQSTGGTQASRAD